MFTSDLVIEAVQNSKKQLVKTFVTNPTMVESLNQFVDAQTEYTKNMVKAGSDAFIAVTQETVKAAQNATKFDYFKFGEGIMKAYNTNLGVFGTK